MPNNAMDTELLDRAMNFAIKAHQGTERRGKGFPYIIHPMEAVAIVATMTNDQELLAAAALHDVVEDTEISCEDIRKEFGDRIAQLVANESDPEISGMSESESWKVRKQIAIDRLTRSSLDTKIVAMGDKLSNMRAIYRDYKTHGDEFWSIFHVSDSTLHEWHYRELLAALNDLKDSFAYREFKHLIEGVWGKS
ncbi:MAG: HD domain-containing protein [Fibrobacter sp.]|nr:HD domain-containing protein [Fibrobacter sp.]